MRLQTKKISINHMFSAYVVLIPILQYYKSPINSLNFATFCAMLFLALFFVLRLRERHYRYKSFLIPAWLFMSFITLNVVVTGYFYNYSLEWNNYSTYIRLLGLFISLIVLGNSYFDIKYALKVLEKVLVVAAIAIIVHVILFSFVHVNFLLILTPYVENTIKVGSDIRSGGLYMEPAHYAQSALLYLIFYIFSKKFKQLFNKRSFYLIILGIVFSTSGQGYAMLILVYVVWYIYNVFVSNSSLQKKILVIVSVMAVAFAVIMLYQIPFVQYSLSRIIDDEGNIGGQALAGRTWTNYKFYLLTDVQRFFGVGFGHKELITTGYVNSMYSYLIQCGYLSIVVFLLMGLYYFIKGDVSVKVQVVFFSVMYTFTGIAAALLLMFYILFFSASCKEYFYEIRDSLEKQPLER